MTAIFAYARDHVSFVAGDTLRVDANLVKRTVCKVHHWSDKVVLAQAGEADQLTELIANLLPLSGWFAEDDGRNKSGHDERWVLAERTRGARRSNSS